MEDNREVRIGHVGGDAIGNAVSGSGNIIGKEIHFYIIKPIFNIVDPSNDLPKIITDLLSNSIDTKKLKLQEEKSIISEILDLQNQNDPKLQTKIIRINDLELSSNQLKLKEAIVNTKRFGFKVEKHNRFWRYFEIKACLQRYDTNDWRILFLYVRLMNAHQTDYPPKEITTAHLKLIHEIHRIDTLDNLLNQIMLGRTVAVGGLSASLEWMTDRIIFDTYYKSHPRTGVFGFDEPSHTLTQTGNSAANTQTNERMVEAELENHDPPYENLENAVHTFLDMRFWSDRLIGGYSPFVLLSAPIPIKVVKVRFTNEDITVHLKCPLETELNMLKVTLFDLHKNMTDFIREGDSTNVSSTLRLSPDKTIPHCKLKLTYDGDIIEEILVRRFST